VTLGGWPNLKVGPDSAGQDYVYFNGRRVAFLGLSSGNQHYYWSDHLGSASVMSNSNGSTIQWEADYYPFGTPRMINNGLNNYYYFTGYEYDSGTGYYNSGFREQSPNWGRFMSPDPVPGNVTDPQSWNRYAYVRNKPLTFTDPNGMFFVDAIGPGSAVAPGIGTIIGGLIDLGELFGLFGGGGSPGVHPKSETAS